MGNRNGNVVKYFYMKAGQIKHRFEQGVNLQKGWNTDEMNSGKEMWKKMPKTIISHKI